MNPALPPTIRARVHENAVKRVTRLFDSGLRDIFSETFQNARRAGATRLRITIDTLTDACLQDEPESREPRFSITIADDGSGISDPAVLLSFGENGWSPDLVEREDAAGFGFASLARRGCTVSSRPALAVTGVPAWQSALAPAHFLGDETATVHASEAAPYPHGTSISFPATETATAIRTAAKAAARHFPLPVFFEGIPRTVPGGDALPRKAFLDGAIHVERWNGLVFGVFRNRHGSYDDPTVNFHGVTVAAGMPRVQTVNNDTWTVRADIDDCPRLELVLPARKEIVQTPFLDELRKAARLCIYRAMANDADPCPAFRDWSRAREAGIDIQPPGKLLRSWKPSVADVNHRSEAPVRAPVPPTALVMAFDPETPESQTLHRALTCANLTAQVFETDRQLEGYDWYDRLDRVIGLRIESMSCGHTAIITDAAADHTSADPETDPPDRPEDILVTLTVQRHGGTTRTVVMATDVVLCGEPWGWLDDARIHLRQETSLQPHELADLLEAAYFSPSDDCEADSWETQREHFRQEAARLSTKLLCGHDEAIRQSLLDATHRELRYLVPRDRAATITISGTDVTVALAPPQEAA